MRIWFNKTFSTIRSVFENLRQSPVADEVIIVCTHIHPTATAFLAADETYLEADLNGFEYLDWCLAFCISHKIDLFWPGKEAARITENQHLFSENGIQVLSVTDFATLRLLNNKAEFYAQLPPSIAQSMEFIAVNDLAAFAAAVAELSQRHAKLCVKPAVSVYGLGFRILDRERPSIVHLLKGVEYQIPLTELQQSMASAGNFDTLLVMEHLAGHEWSVDCAGSHGQLLAAVQRKKSMLTGQGQSIDNHPEIQAMVERLTSHYRLNGIFNIQFKEGKHGPRLLEINPRPSGGFGMACLAGVNLAYLAYQGIKGETVDIPAIRYGLIVNEVNKPVIITGN